MSRCSLSVLLCAVCLVASVDWLQSQPRKREIADHVDVTATASKPEASNQLTVSIILDIDRDFYIFANPVGNENLDELIINVHLTVQGKPAAAKIIYPPGKIVKVKLIGDYQIYQGIVAIQAVVFRPPGNNTPLEAVIGINGDPPNGSG